MTQVCIARRLISVVALSSVALGASVSSLHAEAVSLTSGSIALPWDGSLAGFQLSGPGTELNGEVLQSPAATLAADTRADLSTTIATTTSGHHPFSELVGGVTYGSVWIDGRFTITAQPVAVPAAADGATATFSTPFVLRGTVTGYSDAAMTQQVFSTDVRASGVMSIGPLRFSGGSTGAWAFAGSGSELFVVTGPPPSPWATADVGAVGIPGVSSFSNGVFYVAGAGGDIWGTADAFQFVSQPFVGDGTVVARVDGEQITSPFAKAGVMIRQSADPSAAHVVLDVRPGGDVEFMTRSSAGASTTFLASARVASAAWLKLARRGTEVSASVSTDGATWTPLGTATLDGDALAGLAVTSHDTSVLNQAIVDQLSVTSAGAGGALPLTWSQADIGVVGVAGSGSAAGGTFTVSGAGADIWGTADSFHYVYASMTSGGEIDARVVNLQSTDAFAKAGVMVRDSLDQGAPSVILDARPDGTIEFMARTAPGGATAFLGGGFQAPLPVSLKLARMDGTANSVVTGSVLDASTGEWRQVGSVMLPLGPDATAGLAVTSHTTSALNTAVFDTVDVIRNLVVDAGFESDTPPSLGSPGWISDNPLRAVAAKSETNQPHGGAQNGACWTTTFADCGMYQEVVAPADGSYTFTAFATADRSGGLVGVNVNGVTAQSLPIDVRPFGDYGASPYAIAFDARAGDTIRVWMYSPPTPGYVVIDDAALVKYFGTP